MISLAEQIRCVEREIAHREIAYGHLIATGKMTHAKAQREADTMRAVLETLRQVQART